MQVDGVKVEVALQWCSDSFSDTMLSFVNSIKTIDGGTHMDGFKAALTRTVNSLGRKTKALKEGDPNLSGDHIREGLGAVVSVKVSTHMPSVNLLLFCLTVSHVIHSFHASSYILDNGLRQQ